MIIYEFVCNRGHTFEQWFEGYVALQERFDQGLIRCPRCGSYQITQSLTTGGHVRGRSERRELSPETVSPEAATMEYLNALRNVIETHFEDVGPDFAKTALKIHYGVEEPRNIRGTTTEEEERMLKEDGVEYYTIPFPAKPKESEYN